jgi:formylglycine-generating enzyme required for sulfatase activity
MKFTIKFLVFVFGLQLASMVNAETFRDCPDCPEMVAVPAGSFDMGVNGVSPNEKPTHHVTIAQNFGMGTTEVTQAQWIAVMGSNPSNFAACGDTCPVEMVNWDEAQDFVKKLSAKTGKQYRLPSEAEWEYACHAGGTQQFCGGDSMDVVGWHSGNKNNATHPVGGKQANAFGMFDMSGNVSEWVEDSYHDNYIGAPIDGSSWQGDGKQRVMRGGPWNYPPQLTRAAIRFGDKPTNHFNFNGFRVARVMP